MPRPALSEPFMEADYQGVGWTDRLWKWQTRYEGVFRLSAGFGGVVRWHCPHLHRTPKKAQECAAKEVKRRFGGNGRGVRGMFEGSTSQFEKIPVPRRPWDGQR